MNASNSSFFKSSFGMMHGLIIIVDENLKEINRTKITGDGHLHISPALHKIMKDCTQEKLQLLLENVTIETLWRRCI